MLETTRRTLSERVWYGSHPLRYLLLPLSAVTAVAVSLRRAWFHFAKPAPAPVPVIVVGNLTIGGSGKTPLVMAIAHHLKRRGYKPGIVSRGYGARSRSYPHCVQINDDVEEVGDEPLMLRQKTAFPVVIDPDRRRAVACLAERGDADIAVCDDGLQHYRLYRDIEIAVVDGSEGFGNGLLLPAGPLREPRTRLDSVDLVVVNGGAADQKQFSMQVRPLAFENLVTGEQLAPGAFAGRAVHACAGIARPQRFFDMLSKLGMQVHAHAYPDHHRYQARDVRFEPEVPVVITEKDAVKCRRFATDDTWSLRMEAEPEKAFEETLDALLAQTRHSR